MKTIKYYSGGTLVEQYQCADAYRIIDNKVIKFIDEVKGIQVELYGDFIIEEAATEDMKKNLKPLKMVMTSQLPTPTKRG